MYESAEKIGLQHIKGKQSRKQVEKWIEKLVDEIRAGKNIASEDTPVYKIIMHRDLDGKLLAKHTATVEVLNLLRPTVAISVYIA